MANTMQPNCPAGILKMIGDFWTLEIIQTLQNGEKRFCEIEQSVPKISPTTLTSRLKKMESAGIIRRKKHTIDNLSVVYQLSEKGTAVLPILNAITAFSNTYA